MRHQGPQRSQEPDLAVPVSPDDFSKLAKEPAGPPSSEINEDEGTMGTDAAVSSEPSTSTARWPVESYVDERGITRMVSREPETSDDVEQAPVKAKAPQPSSGRARDVISGFTSPQHISGHVESYKYVMQKDINEKYVEHVITEGHAYELLHRTGWESDAIYARFFKGFKDILPKVSMLLCGHDPDSNLTFDSEMYIDVDDLAKVHSLHQKGCPSRTCWRLRTRTRRVASSSKELLASIGPLAKVGVFVLSKFDQHKGARRR